VYADDLLEIEVGQGVATDDDEGVVEILRGVLDAAGGAQRRLLHDVGDLHADVAAVVEEILDGGGHVAQRHHYFGDAVMFEQVKDVADDRLVDDGHHRLGAANCNRAQARPFTARHDNCFHTTSECATGRALYESRLQNRE
jgi:hypothetical protein